MVKFIAGFGTGVVATVGAVIVILFTEDWV